MRYCCPTPAADLPGIAAGLVARRSSGHDPGATKLCARMSTVEYSVAYLPAKIFFIIGFGRAPGRLSK
jgi:hypothetical protein